MFWCILYHLGVFEIVWLPYKAQWKTGRTSAKVRATKSRRTFRNKRTQSTPLYPKLTFWCILHYFRCIRDRLVALRNSELNGRTTAKVRATKSRQNFLQRTHSIRPIGPQTDALVHFVLFGCIRDDLVALRNSVQNGPTSAKVCATKSRRNFSQRTHPIHPSGP